MGKAKVKVKTKPKGGGNAAPKAQNKVYKPKVKITAHTHMNTEKK